MGPTWVLSAPDGPHVGPINLAIRESISQSFVFFQRFHANWIPNISYRVWNNTDQLLSMTTYRNGSSFSIPSKTIRRLGLPPLTFANLTGDFLQQYVFVTASSKNHYHESIDAVASVQKYFPGRKIYYYDIGLNADQRNNVSNNSNYCKDGMLCAKFISIIKNWEQHGFEWELDNWDILVYDSKLGQPYVSASSFILIPFMSDEIILVQLVSLSGRSHYHQNHYAKAENIEHIRNQGADSI